MGKLYAIDPYVKKPRRASVARRRLLHKKYKERCTMLLMTSKKASRSVPRDLDFVFIDGDHKYIYLGELSDYDFRFKSERFSCILVE